MFIGRWQPLHKGHMWLIDEKLAKGAPVLIAVRDIEPDEKNPFTTAQTVELLKKVYAEKDVEVIVIPDIESVNYGRGVGYEVNEFKPPANIERISATEIRNGVRTHNDEWKKSVPEAIQDMVVDFLQAA